MLNLGPAFLYSKKNCPQAFDDIFITENSSNGRSSNVCTIQKTFFENYRKSVSQGFSPLSCDAN